MYFAEILFNYHSLISFSCSFWGKKSWWEKKSTFYNSTIISYSNLESMRCEKKHFVSNKNIFFLCLSQIHCMNFFVSQISYMLMQGCHNLWVLTSASQVYHKLLKQQKRIYSTIKRKIKQKLLPFPFPFFCMLSVEINPSQHTRDAVYTKKR